MGEYKRIVEVSPEMLTFVGPGGVDPSSWPPGALTFLFGGLEGSGPSTVAVSSRPDPAVMNASDLVFAVAEDACRRIFGRTPTTAAVWHLPPELRAIALAVRFCGLAEPACATFRLAKSIELLCAVFVRLEANTLTVLDTAGELSEGDAVRVLAARRIVDERWSEKLTLAGIARACCLNRAKLTRGFRLMFGCSVSDAIAENRLNGARRMLLTSDLPVSSVGYACGYLNNASFARAFSRRFGMSPTRFRHSEVSA